MRLINLVGRRFGRLLVLANAGAASPGVHLWRCRCDCSADAVVHGHNLRNGTTRSCGCLRREVTARRDRERATHGHSRTRSATYASWRSMRQRCSLPTAQNWSDYGGRGVVVCERWMSFAAFLSDMGERPKGTTLDRIDPFGNYEPTNCRWATIDEQANNRRTSRLITADGRMLTIAQWARASGLNVATIHSRLLLGWPEHEAVMRPLMRIRSSNR